MLQTLFVLFGCLLGAETLRYFAAIPFPAPVIGLFLLAVILSLKRTGPSRQLTDASSALISHMGLLFVPAGVGIIAQFDLLQHEWMPIAVALVCSTLIGVAVTGAVMHWFLRPPPSAAPSHA